MNNYIALQKIRSDGQLNIDVNSSGQIDGQKIAPLLLITFLENAFKHGAKGNTERSFIRINTEIEKNHLNFSVENNKGLVDEIKTGERGGLGLENIKRQLQLLYPGKHHLTIKNAKDSFAVHLQLDL